MPYLHIQVSGKADDGLAAKIAESAVQLTASILGKDPSLTAVVVDFIPASRWFIGAKALRANEARSYHWMVSITDETNTKREKRDYLGAVHKAMGELLGGVAEHSCAHVADLRGSAYGYGGQTQEFRYRNA
jgi:4-oxalocrotonate tautomerase